MTVLAHATPDGSRSLRKKRALTSVDDARETTAVVTAPPRNLGAVDDPDPRGRYAAETRRTGDRHEPDGAIRAEPEPEPEPPGGPRRGCTARALGSARTRRPRPDNRAQSTSTLSVSQQPSYGPSLARDSPNR